MGIPTGNRSALDETLALIETEPKVWVRIGASVQEDGKWYARLVELTGGAPPPGWTAKEWLYPQVIFVASRRTGKAVAHEMERIVRSRMTAGNPLQRFG